MTFVFDEPWNTDPNGQPPGPRWYADGPQPNASIATDPFAPQSPSNVLQILFPQGAPGGSGPAGIIWSESAGFPANNGLLYMRVFLKVSANWTDNGNVGTKFCFLRTSYVGGSDGENHYLNLTSGGDLTMGFSTNGLWDPGAGGDFFPSLSLSKGVWHAMEFLIDQGTSAAANDGSAKIWADGALILDQSGIKMLYDGQTPRWQYLMLDPIYGGGLNPVPADQTLQIDDWYVSLK
jgi:hypothetical protein